jgi:hypothetical protein
VDIRAKNPNFLEYSVIYSATLVVKYDCAYLRSQNQYFVPSSGLLVHWPGGVQTSESTSSTVNYKVGTSMIDIVHPIIHGSKPHSYSCTVQYEFVCPSGQSNCESFSTYMATPTRASPAIANQVMWAIYKLRTQLNIKITQNNAFYDTWNGSTIQVNAYLFSTDTISRVGYDAVSPPPATPQYSGNPNFVGAVFTWGHQFTLSKRAECLFAYPPLADWLTL